MSEALVPVVSILQDPGFGGLKSHIIGLTGLAYYEDKDDALAERVARRLAANGGIDCFGYLDLLLSQPEGRRELDALVSELTIGETFFFRYPEQFDALRTTILPDCIARNREERQLRVWSAGCSTGAEPYSVAVLIHELLGEQFLNWQITILATDINREFLSRARNGRFGDWALRTLDDGRRSELFVEDEGQWLLRNPYPGMVSFAHHNLMTMTDGGVLPDAGGGFDLILCRNVLIYFDRETIQALLPRIADCLKSNCWLLVGPSEPNEDFNRVFATVNAPGTTIYRKSPFAPLVRSFDAAQSQAAAMPPRPFRPPLPRRPEPKRPSPPAQRAAPPQPSLAQIVDLADCGRWDQARRLCDRCLESDGMNPVLHFLSALIHHHNAGSAEAEQSCRKAIYLDRNFAFAHFQLGVILGGRGDQVGARRALLNVLRILESMPNETVLPAGDGLTAGDLRAMVGLRLEGRGRS
ncbi:MAG: CheR family methyltransferase [Rhodospirillaceae bacterium]